MVNINTKIFNRMTANGIQEGLHFKIIQDQLSCTPQHDSWHYINNKHIVLTVNLDIQLQTEIDVLKQTVWLLEKKYLSVKELITLHCDWNENIFGITDQTTNNFLDERKVIHTSLLANATPRSLSDHLNDGIELTFHNYFPIPMTLTWHKFLKAKWQGYVVN